MTPLETSDLLYISNESLKRWDHLTSFTSTLAENVVAFSVSGDGQKVALLRPRKISANGVELYDLEMLDFATKQVVSLLEQIPRLQNMVISSDGGEIAYTIQDDKHIYTLKTNSAVQPLERGDCSRPTLESCKYLSWSSDNRALAWVKDDGIWVSDKNAGAPRLAHNDKVIVTDPKGQQIEMPVQFSDLSWSPNGRFILIRSSPNASDVYWWTLLDALTGRMVQVPNTYSASGRTSSTSWSIDGKVLVASPEDREGQVSLRTMVVMPTSTDLLLQDDIFILSPDVLNSLDITAGNGGDCMIAWPGQTSPGSFNLGLISSATSQNSTLLNLDLKEGQIRPISRFTVDVSNVIWAPDGSGALIIGNHDEVLFASNDGRVIDLIELLGVESYGFIWMPPAPRL
jgi:Tol biopolymer transport system component